MAEHAWLALLPPGEEVPGGGGLAAARDLDGGPAGHLVTWRQSRRPHPQALRVSPDIVVDPSLHDAGPAATGAPWAVSLVVVPRGRRPLFDDPAVVAAARQAMRDPGRAAVSTLVIDSVHWAGAVSAVSADVAQRWPGWWDGDPYSRLAPAVRLLVDPGVLLAVPMPAGPGTQRYSGAPWPAGSFSV